MSKISKHKNDDSVRGDAGKELHAHGKITQSLVTEEMVEKRARQLAKMDGRRTDQVSTSDRIRAKEELRGDDVADRPVDDTDIRPSGMGAPPVSTGRQTEKHLPTDDENEERLVQEGLDEAEHDEMVAASKTRNKSEG